MKITSEWKLQWFEPNEKKPLDIADPFYIDHFWMTTKVPGDVHSTLISKNIIEDPFIGHNDLKCRWVEGKEWWYRTTFVWDDECTEQEYLELIFEGLDTYAVIYLNGVEIGKTENMLVEHSFEITREVKKGKNVLALKFDPVRSHVDLKESSYWCSYGKERIWTRKAAMNFGWDWGPRLVTAGIWKDVLLKKRTKGKFKSVFARTIEVTSEFAAVEVKVDVERHFQNKGTLAFGVQLRTEESFYTENSKVNKGEGTVILNVPNPKLWWTHDLGDPFLYQLTVFLYDENESVIDQYIQDFGIRTIHVEQKHENGKNLFTFNLNGVRIFAKGANWIPVHSFIGSADDGIYRKLLECSKEAHMNMMRVWGGGIYEKDIFYRECDRLGILVWQDFMFANALYPDYNFNFMQNLRDEVSKVIIRLRNYASIAIWCGNNEIDWIYDRKSSDGEITTPFYGEKIYHQLIPELLEELDQTRLYWPSSPFGGNDHDAEDVGDRHNWQVWHGNVEPRKKGEPVIQDISLEGVSFKNYKKDHTLFSSEFGMHASSNRYTLSKYIPEGEFYWKSDEMSYRNKDHFHQKGILLMEGFTGIPATIEEYMSYSMLTQAEGLKYGIEHYRRNKPFTSGALIWQLNDCWPGTSWSLIDYELLPKAAYYYAKKFFDPVLATIDHDPGNRVKVWIVNDKHHPINDKLVLEAATFEGERIFYKEINIEVDSNSVKQLAAFTEREIVNGEKAENTVIRLRSINNKFQENYYYLRDFKDVSYPNSVLRVENNINDKTITITSNQLARFVNLDIPQSEVLCSDNFFDLWPGEAKTIQLRHLEGKKIKLDEIKYSAINAAIQIQKQLSDSTIY
jgi:beta-mannosidase